MALLRLIFPVIAVIVASLLALTATAGFFAHSKDQNAEKADRRILRTALLDVHRDLRVLAEDNVWWDEAVTNLVLRENSAWIESTIGTTAMDQGYVDGYFVLRKDNSILVANNSIDSDTPDIVSILENGLAKTIGTFPISNDNVRASASGFVKAGDRIFAVGLSAVQPTHDTSFGQPLPLSRKPVLVFYLEITPQFILQLQDSLGLKGLAIYDTGSEPPFFEPLIDIAGNTIGLIKWVSARPGSRLLEQLLWPAVALLTIVALTTWHFIARARALLDDLQQADRAKMAFLASMSHEVRTPLNAIVGFAELLRLELYGKIEGDKNKEYLDIIRTSGEHLLTIINDILDISKLEAGRMDISAEAINPVDVLTESVRIVTAGAEEGGVKLLTEFEPATIVSDERIVRQVLINILSNAIKFTAPGGQVSVRGEAKPNKNYAIIITDTGCGMTSEEIEVALEPFGQIGANRSELVKGTGLGLPLVNRFMTLLGGTMTIRSAPGHGTSVSLLFPATMPSGTKVDTVLLRPSP